MKSYAQQTKRLAAFASIGLFLLVIIAFTACRDAIIVTPHVSTAAPQSPTLTATPLLSPIPTLTRAEKMVVTSELYVTNGNCKLPCWWGIVPGETDWQTANLFFSATATKISTSAESETDPYYSASVDIPVPDELSEFGLLRQYIIVRDGIIVEIKTERPWGARKIFTISEILNNYGPPTEVWLDTLGKNYGDNYFPFRVALFYPEQGFLVRYFDEAELANGYVTGCPQAHSAAFVLWPQDQVLTFTETLSEQEGVQYYKLLEEVTEVDVATFYQTYLDPATETCLTTPAELWMDR